MSEASVVCPSEWSWSRRPTFAIDELPAWRLHPAVASAVEAVVGAVRGVASGATQHGEG